VLHFVAYNTTVLFDDRLHFVAYNSTLLFDDRLHFVVYNSTLWFYDRLHFVDYELHYCLMRCNIFVAEETKFLATITTLLLL